MATATLPQGNEAILLSNQARDALDVGDYELAIRLIERISDLPEALVPVSGGRTFYPTWREALRLQAALPDEATRQFQLEFDAKVRGRRDAAIAANDLTALQELFQRFQASTLWPQVGEALVARYLDAGRYYDAVAVLRLLQSGQQQSRLLATQSVIALAAVGARTEAETRLGQYAGSNSGAALIGGEERDTLATWIANRISRTSTDTLPATFSIADAGLFHWTTLIDPARERAASQDRDAQLADAVDYLRRLPLIQPTICEEQLIIRSRGRISAFDTLSLLPRWSIVERQGTAGELQGSPEDWISQDAKRLVAHPLAHSLTSAFGLVFTVESLSVDSRSDEQFGWTGIRSGFGINTLVARDPQTGEVAWELGADQHSPIFQVAFQDDPVAVGDSLCVVYRRQDDLEMARIDPYTGSVLGKINLIGPPTFFSSRGGRCTVAADDSTVYVSTGNGVLAAVDGRTLTWRWATKYPSLLTSLRGRRWWNRAQSPPEFGMQRPVIAEGLVIFAPADAEEIVAVDRFSGRVRWQIVNRAAYQGIVGMVDAGLVLVGHVVTCLSIEDGQRVVWRSVPVEIVGRPLIDGERIYVPTREAVLGLRAKNGKAIEISTTATSKAVRSLALSADDAVTAFALVPTTDGLLAVSPNGITKYADCAQTRLRSAARTLEEPSSVEATFAEAWCDVLGSQWDAAIAKLQALQGGGQGMAQARESLLVRAFVGMAASTEDAEQRLSWLREALQMEVSRESAARISLLIGELLEDDANSEAALRHWLDFIFESDAALIENVAVTELKQSTRQIAEAHAAALLAGLGDEARGEFLPAFQERLHSSGGVRVLSLLRVFKRPAERRALLEAAARGGLPYELFRLGYSKVEPERAADSELSAHLLLERWAAAVAVGDSQSAELAEAQFLAGAKPDATTEFDEKALARDLLYVRLNHEKLKQNRSSPFSVDANTWRWRRNDVDLIVDPQCDRGEMPFAWLLNRESQHYEMVSVSTGETWRRIPQAVGTSGFTDSLADAARSLIQNLRPGDGTQRDDLHSLWYSDMTLVANAEGITVLGNGGFAPDRRGGKRLWARAFPMPQEDGRGWAGKLCAGAPGVFAFTGRDEIVVLDWADGSTRWARKVTGTEPYELSCIEGAVVVVTRDMDWLAFDGETGKALANSRATTRRARSILTLPDRLIVFYDDRIEAIQPRTGTAHWRFPIPRFQWYLADPEAGILLVRGADEKTWLALDCADGALVEIPEIAADGEPIAVARDGGGLFVVERVDRDDVVTLIYKCYDLATKQLRWKRDIVANDIPSRSMLAGNPNCVVALVNPDSSPMGEGGTTQLSLQLIDKETGAAGEPIPIGAEFARGGFGNQEPMVWVTPSRILVEIQGILAAWGPSSWSEAE